MGQHSSKGHKDNDKVETTEVETLVGFHTDEQTNDYGPVKHTGTLILEDTGDQEDEEATAKATSQVYRQLVALILPSFWVISNIMCDF